MRGRRVYMLNNNRGQLQAPSLRETLTHTLKPHASLLIPYIILSVLLGVVVVLSAQIRTYFIDGILENSYTDHTILALLLLNLMATNALITQMTDRPLEIKNLVNPGLTFIISLLLINSKSFMNLLGSYIWITCRG